MMAQSYTPADVWRNEQQMIESLELMNEQTNEWMNEWMGNENEWKM